MNRPADKKPVTPLSRGAGSGITIWNIRSRAPGGVWKSAQRVGSGAAEDLANSLRAEGKEVTVNRL